MAIKHPFEQGSVQHGGERYSPESRRRLSAPAIRTFVAIADLWGLSGEQRRTVLGYPSRSAYYTWRRKAREHCSLTLTVDVLTRISAVLGIHAALGQLQMTEREANEWLRSSHQAPPFNGQQPLHLILSGSLEGILEVSRFLDGAKEGLYMPPNAIDAGFEPYGESEIVIEEAGSTELLAKGLRLRRPMWRSIHTAPRDGSWVLLSGGSIGFGWDGETQPNCVVGQYATSGLGEPCWQFARYDSGHYGEYEAPNHWMPLPDAVPVPSDNSPVTRFWTNALASPADLEIIEWAFPPGEERPEFEVPRFWSNRDLRDPDTIIALVLQKPTTEDLARTIVAYGPRRVIAILERGIHSGDLSVERIERAYEWLGPIIEGVAAAARELHSGQASQKSETDERS